MVIQIANIFLISILVSFGILLSLLVIYLIVALIKYTMEEFKKW